MAPVPDHSALLVKSLEALDDDPKSLDIFLTFGHAFSDSAAYVREILPTVNLQLAGVNQELAKRGESSLPSPPEELTNESLKPPRRLVGLMRYVESLVTDRRRVIWVFYPMEIGAPAQYAQLVNHVNDELKTWSLRMTKLIARDSAISPILERSLDGQPNVKVYMSRVKEYNKDGLPDDDGLDLLRQMNEESKRKYDELQKRLKDLDEGARKLRNEAGLPEGLVPPVPSPSPPGGKR